MARARALLIVVAYPALVAGGLSLPLFPAPAWAYEPGMPSGTVWVARVAMLIFPFLAAPLYLWLNHTTGRQGPDSLALVWIGWGIFNWLAFYNLDPEITRRYHESMLRSPGTPELAWQRPEWMFWSGIASPFVIIGVLMAPLRRWAFTLAAYALAVFVLFPFYVLLLLTATVVSSAEIRFSKKV